MYIPAEDPVVKEKHLAQRRIMERAGNNLKEYAKIIKSDFRTAQKTYGFRIRQTDLTSLQIEKG